MKAQEKAHLVVDLLGKGQSHLRNISSKLKMSASTVSKILDHLETEGVVDYSLDKNKKIFFLRETYSSQIAQIAAEYYKLNAAMKIPSIKEAYEQVRSLTNDEIIILFGSYAKNIHAKSKTISILIDTNRSAIKKEVEENLNSIVILATRLDFNSEVGKSILQNHIILNNVEKFHRKLKQYRKKELEFKS